MKTKLLALTLSLLPVCAFADSSWVAGKIIQFYSVGELVILTTENHHSSTGCGSVTNTAAIRTSTISGAAQAEYAFAAFKTGSSVNILVNDTICEAVSNPIIHSFVMGQE